MRKLASPERKKSRIAMFGALAFGAVGLAVAAGALLLVFPAISHGASDPAAAAAPAAPAVTYKFAKDLVAAGVKGCAPLVETMSGNLMQVPKGQTAPEFQTLSSWSNESPDRRIVGTLIGQKFASTPSVPNGLIGVFASPGTEGKCDGMSVQVVPSPANCSVLQANLIAQNNKLVGALAGVPLLSGAGGSVMLIPTGANTCVIVGVNIAYAK
jgi:hypothetical protein